MVPGTILGPGQRVREAVWEALKLGWVQVLEQLFDAEHWPVQVFELEIGQAGTLVVPVQETAPVIEIVQLSDVFAGCEPQVVLQV